MTDNPDELRREERREHERKNPKMTVCSFHGVVRAPCVYCWGPPEGEEEKNT